MSAAQKCNLFKTFYVELPGLAHLRCPSAGLERDKFDNKTVTFEEHIKEEHNMWHYLFFIVLVKVKDSTEYTGPESYVAEMIKVNREQTTHPSAFTGEPLLIIPGSDPGLSQIVKHLWKTRKIGISAAKQVLEMEMKSVAKEAKS